MSEKETKKLVLVHKNTLRETQLISSFKDDTILVEMDEVSYDDVVNIINDTSNCIISHLAFVYHFDSFGKLPFFEYTENKDSSGNLIFDNSGNYYLDNYTYFNDQIINLFNLLKLQNNNLIVDILTCDLNLPEFKNEVSIIENELQIDIRYSVDQTGNNPQGNWVLESDNVNIKDLYFSNNINDWNGRLANSTTYGTTTSGTTIYLNQTFTMAGDQYYNIPYGYTFDGQGYTIYQDGATDGLFRFNQSGDYNAVTIKNLNVNCNDGSIKSKYGAYLIPKNHRGFRVYNVNMINCNLNQNDSGSIAGRGAAIFNIYDCKVTIKGTMNKYSGGIVGSHVSGSHNYITRCHVSSGSSTGYIGSSCGGISGHKSPTNSSSLIIRDCVCNLNQNTAHTACGGICGIFSPNNNSRLYLNNCYYGGTINNSSGSGYLIGNYSTYNFQVGVSYVHIRNCASNYSARPVGHDSDTAKTISWTDDDYAVSIPNKNTIYKTKTSNSGISNNIPFVITESGFDSNILKTVYWLNSNNLTTTYLLLQASLNTLKQNNYDINFIKNNGYFNYRRDISTTNTSIKNAGYTVSDFYNYNSNYYTALRLFSTESLYTSTQIIQANVYTVRQLHDAGISALTIRNNIINSNYTDQQIIQSNKYTVSELHSAGISALTIRNNRNGTTLYTDQLIIQANKYTVSELHSAGISALTITQNRNGTTLYTDQLIIQANKYNVTQLHEAGILLTTILSNRGSLTKYNNTNIAEANIYTTEQLFNSTGNFTLNELYSNTTKYPSKEVLKYYTLYHFVSSNYNQNTKEGNTVIFRCDTYNGKNRVIINTNFTWPFSYMDSNDSSNYLLLGQNDIIEGNGNTITIKNETRGIFKIKEDTNGKGLGGNLIQNLTLSPGTNCNVTQTKAYLIHDTNSNNGLNLSNRVTIQKCINNCEINGSYAGSFVPLGVSNITVNFCINKGTITSSGAGGFIAADCNRFNTEPSKKTIVQNCINTGNISMNNAGAFFAYNAGWTSGFFELSNCLNINSDNSQKQLFKGDKTNNNTQIIRNVYTNYPLNTVSPTYYNHPNSNIDASKLTNDLIEFFTYNDYTSDDWQWLIYNSGAFGTETETKINYLNFEYKYNNTTTIQYYNTNEKNTINNDLSALNKYRTDGYTLSYILNLGVYSLVDILKSNYKDDLKDGSNYIFSVSDSTVTLNQNINWPPNSNILNTDYFVLKDGEIFDGNNNTIYLTEDNQGIFNINATNENRAIIQNININTINDSLFTFNGLIKSSGKYFIINNCTNSNKIYTYNMTGGFVGSDCTDFTVNNCTNYANIRLKAGGICGNYCSDFRINNCNNLGIFIGDSNNNPDTNSFIGGICGLNCSKGTINNCYNISNINKKNSGGILSYGCSDINVYNCYNTGEISGKGCGGIISSNCSNINVYNCYNTGIISGVACGGICGPGLKNENSYLIKNCYCTGEITQIDGYCGGILSSTNSAVGYYNSNNYAIIDSCYYHNENTTLQFTSGAIVGGYFKGIIRNCYSIIDSNSKCGIGSNTFGFNSGATIENCYSNSQLLNTLVAGDVAGTVDISGCYTLSSSICESVYNSGTLNLTNVYIKEGNSIKQTFYQGSNTFSLSSNSFTNEDLLTKLGNAFFQDTYTPNQYPLLKAFRKNPFIARDYVNYDSNPQILMSEDNSADPSNNPIDTEPDGLLLDNNNDELYSSLSGTNAIINGNNWCIEIIMKNSGDINHYVLNHYKNNSYISYSLYISNSNNLQLWGNTTNLNFNKYNINIEQDINDNRYHHYVFNCNGSNVIMYKDGIIHNSNNNNIPTINTNDANKIAIGRKFNNDNHNSDLDIYKVRIWNKSRTQEELNYYAYRDIPIQEQDENLLINLNLDNKNRIGDIYYNDAVKYNQIEFTLNNKTLDYVVPVVYDLNYDIINYSGNETVLIDLSFSDTNYNSLTYYIKNYNDISNVITHPFVDKGNGKVYSSKIQLNSSNLSYTNNRTSKIIEYYAYDGFNQSEVKTITLNIVKDNITWKSTGTYEFSFNEDNTKNITINMDDYINIINLSYNDLTIDDFTFYVINPYEYLINSNEHFNISHTINGSNITITPSSNLNGTYDISIGFIVNDKSYSLYYDENNIIYKSFKFNITTVNDKIEWNFGNNSTSTNFTSYISNKSSFDISLNEDTTASITIKANDISCNDLSFNGNFNGLINISYIEFKDLTFNILKDDNTNFSSDLVTITGEFSNNNTEYILTITGLENKNGLTNGKLRVKHPFDNSKTSDLTFNIQVNSINDLIEWNLSNNLSRITNNYISLNGDGTSDNIDLSSAVINTATKTIDISLNEDTITTITFNAEDISCNDLSYNGSQTFTNNINDISYIEFKDLSFNILKEDNTNFSSDLVTITGAFSNNNTDYILTITGLENKYGTTSCILKVKHPFDSNKTSDLTINIDVKSINDRPIINEDALQNELDRLSQTFFIDDVVTIDLTNYINDLSDNIQDISHLTITPTTESRNLDLTYIYPNLTISGERINGADVTGLTTIYISLQIIDNTVINPDTTKFNNTYSFIFKINSTKLELLLKNSKFSDLVNNYNYFNGIISYNNNTFTLNKNLIWDDFLINNGVQDTSLNDDLTILLDDGEIFDGNNKVLDLGSVKTKGLFRNYDITTLITNASNNIIKNLSIINGSIDSSGSYLVRRNMKEFTIEDCIIHSSINVSNSAPFVAQDCSNITLNNCIYNGSISNNTSGCFVSSGCTNITLNNCYSVATMKTTRDEVLDDITEKTTNGVYTTNGNTNFEIY
jgi:hypothetical protein